MIDLDLKSYFDTVRHDLLLSKLAKRIRDRDLLRLCKIILKSGGKRGLPQGSVIGPLWSNVFLNEVDRMLEQAQIATRQGPYETVRYTRFADDLVVQINSHPRTRHWAKAVERRLYEELAKLDLTINEDKTRFVGFGAGQPIGFLGYTFRWLPCRNNPAKKMALARPQKNSCTQSLRELTGVLRRRLHVPVENGTGGGQPSRTRLGELLPMGTLSGATGGGWKRSRGQAYTGTHGETRDTDKAMT